jgi:hypothetical protein
VDPVTIAIAAEFAKFALTTLMQYFQTQGMTADQIEKAYQDAKAGMLSRDPSKIPDKPA